MSIAAFNAIVAAGNAALDSGDYAAASLAATKCLFLLVAQPDITRDIGSGSQSLTWHSPDGLKEIISQCARLQKAASAASGGPFRVSKVTYTRPSAG